MTANAIAIRANFVKANKEPSAARSTLTELTKQTTGRGRTHMLPEALCSAGEPELGEQICILDPQCWAHKQSSSSRSNSSRSRSCQMASDTWSALDCEHLITSR